ncbi:MAG: hypothetical protein ACK57B_04150 [Betaproteobacteria bacterium]
MQVNAAALVFLQRLAALVPRPRWHLIRFGVRATSLREVSGPALREHGVLAPNAKLRPLVVPQGPEVQEQPAEVVVADECEVETVQARPHRISWARLLKRVLAATQLEYKLVCAEAPLSTSSCGAARTAAPGN